MKKLNLDYIGEIVSTPRGMSSWSGTTVRFWGKFNEDNLEKYEPKYTRERLIEAISITEERPSKKYHQCSALQIIPEYLLYVD